MASRAMLKLLLLLLVIWHCDAKSSSVKASLKKSTTAAPVVKQEAVKVTTVKPEEPPVNSTPGSVDPQVPSSDAKDKPEKDDVGSLEIPEDVNITSAIGTKTVTSRKCNKSKFFFQLIYKMDNNYY